jgi:hypothetical protein
MKSRSRYFKARRLRLRRRRLCTRCGTEACERGHLRCSACLAVDAVKKSIEREREKSKRLEFAKARLLACLQSVEQVRVKLLGRVQKVT